MKTKKLYIFGLIVLLFIINSILISEPITMSDAENAASFHLVVKGKTEDYSVKDIYTFENDESDTLAYIANLLPYGFIAVSVDTDIRPIITYSFKCNFPYDDDENNILYHMLMSDMELRLQAIFDTTLTFVESNNILWDVYLSEDSSYLDRDFQQWPPEGSTSTGGWVETAWVQTGPYNSFCPLDPVTYDRSLVGCVGTAIAQIINYHKYIGNISLNYYNDGYTTITKDINIDHDHDTLDFPSFNELNNYLYTLRSHYINNNISTKDDTSALNFASGVTINMDYQSQGSGAFMSHVPTALLEKFNYTSANISSPDEESQYYDPSFYDTLSQNMKDALPAELEISSDFWINPPGPHAIVCDGYNTDEEYHLNFGWGETNPDTIQTAWYILPDSLPAFYTIVDCAIMNIEAIYGTVEGIVTLNGNEPGLKDEIYINAESLDDSVIVVTMASGVFIIQLEPGVYNLTASCYGYNPVTIEVEVDENEIQTVNFDLTTHNPDTIIVDINGQGDYTSIQEGIDNAIDSDTVLVYPGTYEENINYNGKLITVASKYLITGDDNYISQTIIDGDSSGSVVTFESQEDNRALLSGFTITHGLADKGGGINISHSFPRLQDLILTENIAESEGGGLYIDDHSYVGISNSIISDNSSRESGGGIYIDNYSEINISNITISYNKTNSTGGGIFCDSNSSLYLTEGDILRNNVVNGNGGGISIGSSSSVEFTSEETEKCNIYLNHAAQNGNDLYCCSSDIVHEIILDTFTVSNPDDYFASPINSYTFDISNHKVEQVNADLYVNPTGSNDNSGITPDEPLQTIFFALAKIIPQQTSPLTIYLSEGVFSPYQSSEVFPINCRSNINLVGDGPQNTILDAEEKSNVIYIYNDNNLIISKLTIKNGYNKQNGGGILVNESNPHLDFLNIIDNTANNGGGISFMDSEFDASNITITNNSALINGGSIYSPLFGTSVNNLFELENSILWNNSPEEIYAQTEEVSATYSDIQYGTGEPWFGDGCIDSDPLLVQEGNHMYHLLEGSPCIDTGNPNSQYNDPDGTRADMGCFPTVYDVKKIQNKWNWVSFPRLERDGNSPVFAPDVLQNIEPFPPDMTLKLLGEGNVWLEYVSGNWIPHQLSDVQSTSGYKLETSNEDNSYLPLSGTRLAPDTQIYLHADQGNCKKPALPPLGNGNWIGYFIPGSQLWQIAFSEIMDKITFIKADDWTYIPGYTADLPFTVDYGKSYIVGVSEDCSFKWQGIGQTPVESYSKPETEEFIYEEKADYMPVFVDSTDTLASVDKIGVFLDDECIGASVVEEFPVFIPVYIDDYTQTKGNGELTFQTATYGKSIQEHVSFYVYDNLKNDFVEKSLRLNTKNYAFVRLGKGTGISYPDELIVYQNYPNPIRNTTNISFILPQDNNEADIKIYNIKGQLVKELDFRASDIGFNAVWDGTNYDNKPVSNGIYFYKVTSGKYSKLKKMLLVR